MKRKGWKGRKNSKPEQITLSSSFAYVDDLLIEDQPGPKQQTRQHNELPKGRGVTQYTTQQLLYSSTALFFSLFLLAYSLLSTCRNCTRAPEFVRTTVPPERRTLTGALPVRFPSTYGSISQRRNPPCAYYILPPLLRILRSLFLFSCCLLSSLVSTQRGERERERASRFFLPPTPITPPYYIQV